MSESTDEPHNDSGQLGWLSRAVDQALSSAPRVKLVDVFADMPYRRTSLLLRVKHGGDSTRASIAARTPEHGGTAVCDELLASELVSATHRIVTEAINHLDLRQHVATHPRLGTVDHVVFHALNTPGNDQTLADEAARLLAERLHSTYPTVLPIFLYGGASSNAQQRRLQDLRRALGYFSGKSVAYGSRQPQAHAGRSHDQLDHHSHGYDTDLLPIEPDLGPCQARRATGLTFVGSTPWVTNLNVQLTTRDRALARDLARRVSARHGGLDGVEAMALQHHDGHYEVACNLLVPKDTTLPDRVVRELELACHELSRGRDAPSRCVAVSRSYVIGGDPASVSST